MPLRRLGILSAIRDRIGEVQETPSDNTLLGRLKDLLTGIVLAAGSAIIGKVGIDQSTHGTTNAVVAQGIDRSAADAGLEATGSIVFDAGDNLTTEKKTASISLTSTKVHPDALYLLAIDKPQENTAENLTIYTYNQIKVDGTNSRDTLGNTLTVEFITDAATYRYFLIQGLWIGEGTIKLGMKFAVDSGAITVYYKIFRI